MGSYNSEYESYYSSMKKKNIPGYHTKSASNKTSNLSFIERRIITDLTGVLILFCFVLFCRLIVTPGTKALYQYSKNIVNENFDYQAALNKVKGIGNFSLEKEGHDVKQSIDNKIDFLIAKLKMEN